LLRCRPLPYAGPDDLRGLELLPAASGWAAGDFFGVASAPVPYAAFKARMEQFATVSGR